MAGMKELTHILAPELQAENRRLARRQRGWHKLLPLLTFCVLGYYGSSYLRASNSSPTAEVVQDCASKLSDESPELIWGKLNAHEPEDLTWVKCYQVHFECSRLKVPLDYSNPSAGYAEIALIKYPAKVPTDHPEYRGPVLFNPGGPGASGVGLVSTRGAEFQEILGLEYDIVGFDPRGVAHTIPQVQIFSDEAEGVAYRMKMQEDPLFNTTADAVSRFHARYSILGGIAATSAQDTAQYVSTALVARDMLSIIRTFGRDKLQYWGFSYGTVLGATFAAMFPDNVERIIIDGVMDSYNYYQTLWSNNLRDTDKGLQMFAQACVEAGPYDCAIYEPTAAQVQTRIRNLFDKLKANPVPVLTHLPGYSVPYGVIDYKIAKTALFLFLYSPYTTAVLGAPRLAAAYRYLENGEGAALWSHMNTLAETFSCDCPVPGQPTPPSIATPDAAQAIMCGDGDPVMDTVEDLESHLEALSKDSEFWDMWPTRGMCIGWKIRPVERFTGPFIANTSFPLLLIGNTADPVTPLVNAHKMSTGFNGSVVLTQDSAGHCSIKSTSLCTAQAVRAYFREGKLPEPNTVCQTSSRMFGGGDYEQVVEEDKALVHAWQKIGAPLDAPLFAPEPSFIHTVL